MPGPYSLHTDRVTGGPDPAADMNAANAAINESASAATPNVLILRDSFGRAKVALPAATDDIATKGYADGLPFVARSLYDVKGDLLVGSADDTTSRLAVGADGLFLIADSSQALGMRWGSAPAPADATAGSKGILQLAGDLSGTAAAPTVAKVNGVAITGAPSAGQVPIASGGTAAAWGTPSGYIGVNAQTGTTYTPVLSDQGKFITLNNAAAITVTLPQDSALAIPVGGQLDFAGIGAGLVTFVAGTGATVRGTPSTVTRAQYSAVTAIKYAANTWLIVGDCA